HRVRDPRSGLVHHGRSPLCQRLAGRARAHLDRGQAGVQGARASQHRGLGPDLAGVTKRRSDAWLTRWLKAPEKMLESDADAKAMLKEFNNLPMPNQNLPEAEIREYLKYFKWYDEQGAKAP